MDSGAGEDRLRSPAPVLDRLFDGAAGAWFRPRSPLFVVVAVVAWLTLVANLTLWHRLAAIDPTVRGVAVGLGVAAIVFLAHLALLGVTAWGRTAKPVWMLVIVVAAVAQHFMLRYGAIIDPAMIGSALATDRGEVRDLVGAGFAIDVAATAGPPLAWLWTLPIVRADRLRTAGRALATSALALVLLVALSGAMFRVLAPMVRNHMELRYLPNPLMPLVSAWRAGFATSGDARQTGAWPSTVGARPGPSHGASAANRPPLVLLVVGETARADHFGINGYARDTTPELAARGVTSFVDVRSCGTHTAASLPCMFSPLGKAGFRRAGAAGGNLLDVVAAAGLAVLWVDNQSGCKGVCERVAHASTADLVGSAAAARLCRDGECLDEALLEGLDERIAALPESSRRNGVLVVLHQMGSHGPAYGRRSPAAFKRFVLECSTSYLNDCVPAELVNAYDNSIAYTDHVLARAIDWLRQREPAWAPALLYVSDHGESLGEYGVFLHGLPEAIAPQAQTHVPMIAWLGATIARRDGIDEACVARQARAPLGHDHLYHSVLGLLDVATPTYRRALDVWAPCRHATGAPAEH